MGSYLDWSANEFFYAYATGQPTPVQKKEDSSKKEAAAKEKPVLKKSFSGISVRLGKSVEIEVPICCESCGREIVDALTDVEGVTAVTLDYKAGKVTLQGDVSPKEALRRMRRIKPKATHKVLSRNVEYVQQKAGA